MSVNMVYKYELLAGAITNITLPAGSEVLCTKVQRETICIWVLMGKGPSMNRRFLVAGTGIEFHAVVKGYIGTVMTPDHSFVFHVFEVL